MAAIAFWALFALVFYAYLGYGVVIFGLVRLKRLLGKPAPEREDFELPTVTLIVAAYNEEDYIEDKIDNSLSLAYPAEKIDYIFVTDGSDDGTAALVAARQEVLHLHQPERRGKIAAVHRSIAHARGEILVFTDANTLLNEEALLNIVKHYADPRVGGVAGEKKVHVEATDDASGAGEGLYWRYESLLKKWDAEFLTVVGAAGELFSVRRELYEPVPPDSVIEDFMMSLGIAQRGYKVAYAPDAYASESPSASVKEELKRKIRIASGGIQSIVRLRALLNVFRYGWLTFTYVSHRVLRWTVCPFALILIFFLNAWLAFTRPGGLYPALLGAQIAFYLMAWAGYLLESRKVRVKAFFVPYYFAVMNYAVLMGIRRYFARQQNVVWEKAARRQATS